MNIKDSTKKGYGQVKSALTAGATIVTGVVKDVATQTEKHVTMLREDNPKLDGTLTKGSEIVGGTTEKIVEVMDHVTGESALAEARNLLEKQRRYNDILATRLAEALDRIAALENRLDHLEREQ